MSVNAYFLYFYKTHNLCRIAQIMFIYVTLSKLMTNRVALFVDIFGVNLLLSKNTSDNQHIKSVNYI